MTGCIYICFSDLSEDKQDEIIEIAKDEIESETTQEEADNLNMSLEDLINERVEKKLLNFSHEGRFVFNY